MDACNMLKPALARGELHVIGATTLDEYRKHIEKDAALERRFQPVLVARADGRGDDRDPARPADRYEAHHQVRITDEALVAAAELSDRYITDRFLPDKAIDLIDQAGARVRLRTKTQGRTTRGAGGGAAAARARARPGGRGRGLRAAPASSRSEIDERARRELEERANGRASGRRR